MENIFYNSNNANGSTKKYSLLPIKKMFMTVFREKLSKPLIKSSKKTNNPVNGIKKFRKSI